MRTRREDAPIGRWNQDSAHDTARECEAARQELVAFDAHMGPLAKDPAREAVLEREQQRFMKARCVPTESVYPPTNPPGVDWPQDRDAW
jgi:hypothetical protein